MVSMTAKFIYSLCLLLVIVLAPQSSHAQESALDPTFDSDGRAIINTGNPNQLSQGVALQADGKLVVVADNTGFSFITTRLNADGSPDASFGTNGRATTPIPDVFNGRVGIRDVAIQTDGKIIAAGYSGNTNFRGDFNPVITVARYNTDGSLDDGTSADTTPGDSFGTSGISKSFGGEPNRIALQADGKIVVCGFDKIVRLNTDGSPDTTFDGDGLLFINGNLGIFYDVVIQADGRIVLAGTFFDRAFSGRSFVRVVRYNVNGSLDDGTASDQTPADTFGTGGAANLASSRTPLNSNASGVLLQADGRIVISGSVTNSPSDGGDTLITRFTTTGAPDTTFGTDGATFTNFFTGNNGGQSSDTAQAVVEQPGGKLVLVGTSTVRSPFFAFTRYSSDGVLDTTLGVNGRVAAFIPNFSNVQALGAIVQRDGKIVAVGQARNGDITAPAVIPIVRLVADPPVVTFNDDPNNLVVNSIGTAGDDTTNDGRCATRLFGSECTLQAALDQVASDGSATAQTIGFNIPGDGTRTIPIAGVSFLPNNITIDGFTQPGASANTRATGSDAVMRVELSGNGELILSQSVTLRGLVINLNGNRALLMGSNNIVEGCFIGTNASGTASGSNRGIGIGEGLAFFNPTGPAPNNRIGGSTPAQRNVIFGNISLVNGGSTGNRIENNYINTDKTGSIAFSGGGNNIGSSGIDIGAPSTTVVNNVISGGGFGIGIGGDNNTIQSNRIGTNAAGQAALPNNLGGISISGSNNTIGGTSASAGNIISGNTGRGVQMIDGAGAPPAGNRFQSNLIGVAADGITPLGNIAEGFYVATAGANIIGAEDASGTTQFVSSGKGFNTQAAIVVMGGGGNIIANNGFGAGGARASGVFVASDTIGIRILSNSIYNNGGLGIDLRAGGSTEPANSRTPNDPDNPGTTPIDPDSDAGGNNLQNYPVIQSASVINSNTRVTGSLNSTPNRQFVIQFFSTPAANSQTAQGQTLLGSRTLTTDANGNVFFDESLPQDTLGGFVTATATDLTTFDTSEFSAAPTMPTADDLIIAGVVRNLRGAPVSGVTIRLNGSAQMTTVTDSQGRYSFADVPNGGIYTITAQASGKRFSPSSFTLASIVSNQTADFIVIESKARPRLGGRSRSFD